MSTIEYRVRPVTRFSVTRYEETDSGESVGVMGEFDNEVLAVNAAGAFAFQETQLAQPADKIIRHDGDYWERKSERWSNEPQTEMVGSVSV